MESPGAEDAVRLFFMPFLGGRRRQQKMETTRKPNYVEELLEIFRSPLNAQELRDQISDYHESDIADAFEQLSVEETEKLYRFWGRNGLQRSSVILKTPTNICRN